MLIEIDSETVNYDYDVFFFVVVCLGQNKIILQDTGGWRWSLKYAIAG